MVILEFILICTWELESKVIFIYSFLFMFIFFKTQPRRKDEHVLNHWLLPSS